MSTSTSTTFTAEDFEEIQVTLTLRRNIVFVSRLISYQQNKTFDEFVNEEIRQAILGTGPDETISILINL